MIKRILPILLTLVAVEASSQIVISANTTITTANNPDIVILTGSNITNNSSFDFSSAQLYLGLAGTDQNLVGNIVPLRLRVDGGGTENINGHLTVKEEFNLLNGFLRTSGVGKILFIGAEDGLSGGNESSYVEGLFFVNGSGFRTFPLGAQGLGYAPLILQNAPGTEVGVEVVNSGAGLSPAISEVEISAIDNTHYWSISTENDSPVNSVLSLSLTGTPAFSSELSPVVVEADAPGGEAFNIGSLSSTESLITSVNPVTRKIVTIGGSSSVDIKIHDLISPFTADNINDELYIENIGKFPSNTVTLLDRYGVLVKEWKNFTNYADPLNPNQDLFSFGKLSPGNYICIVEYSSPTQGTQRKSQMVTVLKVN